MGTTHDWTSRVKHNGKSGKRLGDTATWEERSERSAHRHLKQCVLPISKR